MSGKRLAAMLLAVLALAACSGTKEVVVREVSATPDPLADLYRVAATADTYLQSRIHFDGDTVGGPRVCRFALCQYLDGSSPYTSIGTIPTIAFQGIEPDRIVQDLRIVVTRNDAGEWISYGAWMDHAGFLVNRDPQENADGGTDIFAFAETFGQVSREPLPLDGTATWRGAMVAVDVTTYDRYAGDADLAATFGEGQSMDVRFTGIANVETGAAREDISFENLSLGLNTGTDFIGWSPADTAYGEAPVYINGHLLGPDHAEAAGVFGYHELVGAFGARKQD